MANPRRGEVEVELEGHNYVLVFDYNAISDIEAAFGDRSVDSLFFSGSISRRALREAIRVGLEKKNRRHTPKQVGRMLDATVANDPEAFARIMRAVITGLMAANGVAQEKIDNLDRMLDEEAAEVSGSARAETKAITSKEETEETTGDRPPLLALETGTG